MQTETIRTLADFSDLRVATAGIMSAEVFQALYEASLGSKLDVIDIGVGRGGTSISYAWGILDACRVGRVHAIDQFFQHKAPRPHQFTKATHPDDCVTLNIGQFNSNLAMNGVEHLVTLWPGTTDEISRSFSRDVRAGILSIDVDGHIDRDLLYFYDFVEEGGLIIIDDCADTINKHGRENINKMRGRSDKVIRQWLSNESRWKAGRVLGKNLLTSLLTRYFESIGALAIERTVGASTVICRKTYGGHLSSLDLSGLESVHLELADRFVSACTITEKD